MTSPLSVLLLIIVLHISIIKCQKYKGFSDILSAAGDHETGKLPKLVFINNFDDLPLSHYPVKKSGASRETPPNRRFLLPPYMFYIINSLFLAFTIIIAFHLIRRRPIDHSYGTNFIDQEKKEKHQNKENALQAVYKKCTGHVTTTEKLMATFERDFDAKKVNDAEYAKKKKTLLLERMKFTKISDDDKL